MEFFTLILVKFFSPAIDIKNVNSSSDGRAKIRTLHAHDFGEEACGPGCAEAAATIALQGLADCAA